MVEPASIAVWVLGFAVKTLLSNKINSLLKDRKQRKACEKALENTLQDLADEGYDTKGFGAVEKSFVDSDAVYDELWKKLLDPGCLEPVDFDKLYSALEEIYVDFTVGEKEKQIIRFFVSSLVNHLWSDQSLQPLIEAKEIREIRKELESLRSSIAITVNISDETTITGDGNINLGHSRIGQLIIQQSGTGTPDPPSMSKETGEKVYRIEGYQIHNLPFARNPLFTGREDFITKLHNLIAGQGSAAVSQAPAISGMGGIGKTQIAVEYAYRHMSEYKMALWIRSENESSILSSFSEIARLLDLPAKTEQDLMLQAQLVRQWIEQRNDWLMIFDNADDPDIIRNYVPRSNGGHVLITSRASAFGDLAKAFDLDEMPPDEARDFLFRRSKIEDKSDKNVETADKICEELGYLPLAIEQAGAYIERNGCSFDNYLRRYSEKGIDVFKDKRYEPKSYEYTVATTWLISCEKIRENSPASANLLELCAFLAPDGIPVELLKQKSETLEKSAKEFPDPSAIDEALGDLRQYSLIKRNDEADDFSIHRLLQAVIREMMSEDDTRLWVEVTIVKISASLPDVKDFANWTKTSSLVRHIVCVLAHSDSAGITTLPLASLLDRSGYCLTELGNFELAELFFSKALSIAKSRLDSTDMRVLVISSNLAQVYKREGQSEKAIALIAAIMNELEALVASGKLSDLLLDYSILATFVDNAASLLRVAMLPEEAEQLFRRALRIFELSANPDLVDWASTLCNYASLLVSLRRYNEAEALTGRALGVMKIDLSSTHPVAAKAFNILAVLHMSRGENVKADSYSKRSLEIRERIFPPDHPVIANSLHTRGEFLYRVGSIDDGIALVKRAHSILKNRNDSRDPDLQTIERTLRSWGVEP